MSVYISLSLNNFAFCCSPQWPEEPRAWTEQREWFSILTRLRGYAHDWIHKWNVLTPFRVNLHAWVWVIVFSSDRFFSTRILLLLLHFAQSIPSMPYIIIRKSACDASMFAVKIVRGSYMIHCSVHRHTKQVLTKQSFISCDWPSDTSALKFLCSHQIT